VAAKKPAVLEFLTRLAKGAAVAVVAAALVSFVFDEGEGGKKGGRVVPCPPQKRMHAWM
jgi:hypothetical protein